MHREVLEAGCDEAGRGCLAGPVYAAAVILPKGLKLPGLDDSKKVSEKSRNRLRKIIEKDAISWSVAHCSELEIDKINILNASIMAMQKAVLALRVKPEHLLIDGNRFKPLEGYAHTTVVKGDSKYRNIAAASILAKTHRDEYMKVLDAGHPEYGFARNKGYGTRKHIEAIDKFGLLECHRKSFHLKKNQLKLF